MSDALMTTYNRLPVTFVSAAKAPGCGIPKARGIWTPLAGVAVCSLGHAHPPSPTLCAQAGQLVHTSNIYGIAQQAPGRQADRHSAGMDRVFFCNSGGEANEAAIKLARMYGHKQGIESPAIIVMEKAFHGRTLATLSATGNRKVQAGFEPLVSGFVRVPYNDLEAIRQVAQHNSPMWLRCWSSRSRARAASASPDIHYLQGNCAQLCDEHGWLLMLDEVQIGMGRTGKWFAFQHTGIVPDVMTLAKGLGNGVPIGACLARGRRPSCSSPAITARRSAAIRWPARAGLAVVETLQKDNLMTRAAALGAAHAHGLQVLHWLDSRASSTFAVGA